MTPAARGLFQPIGTSGRPDLDPKQPDQQRGEDYRCQTGSELHERCYRGERHEPHRDVADGCPAAGVAERLAEGEPAEEPGRTIPTGPDRPT